MDKQLLISTGVVENSSGSALCRIRKHEDHLLRTRTRDTFLTKGVNEKGAIVCDFKFAPFSRKEHGSGGEVGLDTVHEF